MARRNIAISCAAIFGAMFGGGAFGATYYIGPAGDDANSGLDAANPLAGFQAALAKEDVTEIRLLEGDYTALPTAPSSRANFTAIDFIAEVDKPVAIVGAGPDRTILRCRSTTYANLCGIRLANTGASLSGVTIRDGGSSSSTFISNGWGLDVAAGVISNCVVTGVAVANNRFPALSLSSANAKAYGCAVTNNVGNASNMKYPNVIVSNGLLADSIVAGNVGGDDCTTFGLAISGTGMVRGCLVADNDGYGFDVRGGGVHMSGGLLADSRIVRNRGGGRNATQPTAGGCYVTGGTVTNCLFVGNRDEAMLSSASAGGLLVAGSSAVVRDCTFAENTSFTAGPQILVTSGKAANILVESGDAPDYGVTGGTLDPVAAAPAPGFRDRVDFELPYASDWSSYGWRQPRAPSSIDVALFAGRRLYRAGADVVVTALVANASAASYSWTVTCGPAVSNPAADAVLTLASPPAGDYVVAAEAFDAGGVSLGRAETSVKVMPPVCFVSPTGGSGTYPYDTPEKATSSIQAAVDAVYADEKTPGVVHLAGGTYDRLEPRQYILCRQACRHVIVTKPVHIFGATDAPGDTLLVFSKGTSADKIRLGGVLLANPLALLAGVTIRSVSYGDTSDYYQYAVSLDIGAGTASNVVVTGVSHSGHISPTTVIRRGGLLTHSSVRDNHYTTTGRMTAGVFVQGGKMRHSQVLRNSEASKAGDLIKAIGVYVSGASSEVSDCLIEGNSGGGNYAQAAGGLYMAAGLVERCIIQCNTNTCGSTASSAQTAGGVYFGGGTLRNCFIGGNVVSSSSADSAGGVYLDAAGNGASHLTVVGNAATAGTPGVVTKGTALRASIIAKNGITQVTVASGGPLYCCYAEASETVGTGNSSATIAFADGATPIPVTWETVSGYAITKGSGGYNLVAAQYAADDLLRQARPELGGEDGNLPDAGAFEFVSTGRFEAYVNAATDNIAAGDGLTLSLVLDGNDTTIREAVWQVTNGGQTTTIRRSDDHLPLEALAAGDYTVSVVVENASGAFSTERSLTFHVSPTVCYVGLGGSDTWPYDTAETACSNVCDAIAAVHGEAGRPGTVWVLPGRYGGIAQKPANDAQTYVGYLTKPVRVIGRDGPDTTILVQAADDNASGFFVSHEEAVLAGVTITGQYNTPNDLYAGAGAGITLSAGVVSNCIVRDLANVGTHMISPVLVKGGRLVDCRILGNNAVMSGWGRACAGLYLQNGLVSGCAIVGNRSATGKGDLMTAGGAYVTGGVLSNCVIRANASSYSSSSRAVMTAGGVQIQGGQMWNCIVCCNTNESTRDTAPASGISIGSATVRNCLVYGNVHAGTAEASPAVLVSSASSDVSNLTVADNEHLLASASVTGLRLAAGTVANTIVWRNGAGPDFVREAGTFSEGCLENPCFRRPERGDYHLTSASVRCLGKGLNQPWMDNAPDLDGNPRVIGRVVDVGCYEFTADRTLIILR